MVENITNGLDDALSQWIKKLDKQTADMSPADQLDIAMAGGQVFEKHLRDETKSKHYSSHNDKKFGHAADHIGMSVPKTNGGRSEMNTRFGTVIVGWKNRYHAMNMMRLNDGTKHQIADHFVTNLRHDPQVRAEILEAEQKKYQEVIRKKGND